MRTDEIDLHSAVLEDIAQEHEDIPLWIIARTLTALSNVLSSNGLAIIDDDGGIIEL